MTLELPAGEKAVLSMQLPSHFIIVFEPVTHSAHFIDVQGEPTKGTSAARTDLQQSASADRVDHLCVRVRCGSRSTISPTWRTLPTVFVAADVLHHLLGKRRPFLTAKRMLSNQTFRDVFKADNLNIDQRLKITPHGLFTDLKGSTALYERVGDLVAFDLVRAHFHALLEIIAAEKGAVVKTIGDAVMATFFPAGPSARRGLADAGAMEKLNAERGKSRPDPKDRHP